MPDKKPDDSQIVRVRLPHALLQRLDRYLDWSEPYRRVKSSRNAAMREALRHWLDAQAHLAGVLEPQAQRRQFQAAYQRCTKGPDWVAIPHLRQLLPWPREPFDAVVEALRADHHVELERTAPDEMSDSAIHNSYQVHGQLYARLRWRG
jgi:hypothetical protein